MAGLLIFVITVLGQVMVVELETLTPPVRAASRPCLAFQPALPPIFQLVLLVVDVVQVVDPGLVWIKLSDAALLE